jgi:hypothetical protein
MKHNSMSSNRTFTGIHQNVGDIRYEVEWCDSVPLFPDSKEDYDIDRAIYLQKYFTRFDTALDYAKEILPKDWFCDVRIEKQELQVDEDTLKYEGWARKIWISLSCLHVCDKDEVLSEGQMEECY